MSERYALQSLQSLPYSQSVALYANPKDVLYLTNLKIGGLKKNTPMNAVNKIKIFFASPGTKLCMYIRKIIKAINDTNNTTKCNANSINSNAMIIQNGDFYINTYRFL